jgi:hypothetical protein
LGDFLLVKLADLKEDLSWNQVGVMTPVFPPTLQFKIAKWLKIGIVHDKNNAVKIVTIISEQGRMVKLADYVICVFDVQRQLVCRAKAGEPAEL